MRVLVTTIASSFYAGFFPLAPATFACLLWSLLLLLVPGARVLVHPVALLVTFALSIPLATAMESWYGTDASCIVIDELVGLQLTLFLVPLRWQTLLAGFLLFRLFDIVKPWPARRLQEIPGGWGVVLDDVAAGLYAWVCLEAALRALPSLLGGGG